MTFKRNSDFQNAQRLSEALQAMGLPRDTIDFEQHQVLCGENGISKKTKDVQDYEKKKNYRFHKKMDFHERSEISGGRATTDLH